MNTFYCSHPDVENEVSAQDCEECAFYKHRGCKYYYPLKTDEEPIDQLIKRFYRLYVQYLSESKKYRNFCYELEKAGITLPIYERRNRQLEVPADLEASTDPLLLMSFSSIVCVFGNIFSALYSFEKWWSANKDLFLKSNQDQIPAVMPYGKVAKLDMELVLKDWIREHRREPSVYEFIDYYCEVLNEQKADILYINRVHERPLKKLLTDFVELIDKRFTNVDDAKDILATRWMRSKRAIEKNFPVTSLSCLYPPRKLNSKTADYLETYLRAYQLRKSGHTYGEICNKLQIDNSNNKDSARHRIMTYLKYANRLIANAEAGIFPGYYD